MSDPTRRDLLKQTLGASLFFGFSSWSALAKDGPQPGALKRALKVMKETKRHGVALVIPSDAKQRKAFVGALSKLFPVVHARQAAPALARHLIEHVWVCVEAKEVGAKPGETVVFLDPAGKRVDGAKLDLGEKTVATKLATLLDGKGRLAKRAQSAQTKQVAAALQGLAQKAGWQKHYYALQKQMPAALPALLVAGDAKDANKNVKGLVGSVLQAAYWNAIRKTTAFPFGVKWRVDMNEPAPCPPCGMAAPSITARRFLDFITKP